MKNLKRMVLTLVMAFAIILPSIVFAETKEAKIRGYDKGRFSFNVKGGRCEAC